MGRWILELYDTCDGVWCDSLRIVPQATESSGRSGRGYKYRADYLAGGSVTVTQPKVASAASCKTAAITASFACLANSSTIASPFPNFCRSDCIVSMAFWDFVSIMFLKRFLTFDPLNRAQEFLYRQEEFRQESASRGMAVEVHHSKRFWSSGWDCLACRKRGRQTVFRKSAAYI